MLPSMLSNLFWGAPQTEELGKADVKHTTCREEAGDWLLISRQNSCESGSANSNSRVNSECDLDSVCSDGSWILTPAPTFKHSAGSAPPDETLHPLEDLLIEHPTMSFYHQNSINEESNESEIRETEVEVPDANLEEQNQNRELVLFQNRRRQQLAAHMQIPLTRETVGSPRKDGNGKPPKLTRRALKRHNNNSALRLGVKHQVQKCGFKAGRRRC